MTEDEEAVLERLRRAPTTVQTLVPEKELNEKIQRAKEEILEELLKHADRKAAEVVDTASRRRFGVAVKWMAGLTVVLVILGILLGMMYAYGSVNRERIERLERHEDGR